MQKKRKKNLNVKGITVSAMIAALYVVLSYACDSLGLLRGVIQLRLPEALCVLCAFTYILNLLIAIIAAYGIGFKQIFIIFALF